MRKLQGLKGIKMRKGPLILFFIGIKTSKILKLSPIIAFKVNADGGIWLQEEIFHCVAVGCRGSMAG
jgi:hypothetical protein